MPLYARIVFSMLVILPGCDLRFSDHAGDAGPLADGMAQEEAEALGDLEGGSSVDPGAKPLAADDDTGPAPPNTPSDPVAPDAGSEPFTPDAGSDPITPDAGSDPITPDGGIDIPVDGGGSPPDGGVPSTCPSGMLYIASANVCIDRYEASMGVGGAAASEPDVMPWDKVSWSGASAACAAAGKRLCEEDEWESACSGPPPGTVFPYGDTYEEHTCNTLAHGVLHNLPTGSMTGCEGGYQGLFDMSGNVREWINVCSGADCRTAGGSYTNQGSWADHFMKCGNQHQVLSTLNVEFIGFRCCKDPDF